MKARRRKKKAAFIVPVVSMGDIAFLLIIFFMLCSHFAKEARDVTPARSEDIDALAKARILVLIDKEETIYYDGSAISGVDELEGRLGSAINEDTPPELRRVQLKVDATVGADVYKPVLEVLGKSGATIEFVGEPGPRRPED